MFTFFSPGLRFFIGFKIWQVDIIERCSEKDILFFFYCYLLLFCFPAICFNFPFFSRRNWTITGFCIFFIFFQFFLTLRYRAPLRLLSKINGNSFAIYLIFRPEVPIEFYTIFSGRMFFKINIPICFTSTSILFFVPH